LSRKLRTAILGCGKVAHLHAAALRDLEESEFVSVCDNNVERANAFAAKYGVMNFADCAEMITRSGVEVLVVCTPHPLHAQGALAGIENGVHVLVEKPLASTVSDCDAMISVAKRKGLRLGVVSQRRFFEPVMRMKAAIEAGKIGDPILGTVAMFSWRDEAYYRSDPWRGKWRTEGGGVLINQSPHHIDILQWLMGPVEEVSGRWANLNHPYIEVEDTVVAILRFRSGGLGSITVSVSQNPGLYTKIHIHGSNGASVGAQTDTGATFIAGVSEVAEPPLNDVWTIPNEEHRLEAYREEDRLAFNRTIDPTAHYHKLHDRDFLCGVLDGRDPAVTGEEGRKVVAIIEAIYQSGRDGSPVRFD
jgi:UDP-N-acetyl-2-amino-2-deoxyglucuronate dehydrogenase